MSAGSISRTKALEAELSAANRPDAEIDLSDIPEITDWSDAVRGKFYRPIKKPVSIRLDADVLAWFRSLGAGYQSKINDALRDYMRQHRKSG